MDTSFLTNDAEKPEALNMARLKELLAEYKQAQSEVELLESQLKDAKLRFNVVSQTEIPDFVLQSGLSELKTPWGERIQVKTEVSASVTDIEKLDAFATTRGEDAIFKVTLEFGKLDDAVLQALLRVIVETTGLAPKVNKTVHPMTLKKYVKDVAGLADDFYESADVVPVDQIPGISAYIYHKTTVK